jgi:hypothetical protein
MARKRNRSMKLEIAELGKIFEKSRVREWTRKYPRRKRFKHVCPMGCNLGKKRAKQVELHREYFFQSMAVTWVLWLECQRCGAVYRYNHQRGFREWDTLCNKNGWERARAGIRTNGKLFPTVKVPKSATTGRGRSGKS